MSSLLYPLLSKEEKLKKNIHDDVIIALVDEVLYQAIAESASDIHIESYQQAMLIRYRIDGVLYDKHKHDHMTKLAVISRIKILSNLDIAQHRIAQDGRFKATVNRNEQLNTIDFRVATYPSLHGEKVVIRILDSAVSLLSLSQLGLHDEVLHKLESLIKVPHGLFLTTGPTGCGKTTMLYALIQQLNVRSRNIITLEDPIEYEIVGVTQSQVNNKTGFSFDNGLRSLVRQDPDIIMIGEIRDQQTAHIAIEAALTGHLILSTMHTNDSVSAVTRLIEMGIEPFLISATVVAVLAQRLVRRLCDVCKEQKKLTPAQLTFVQQRGFSFDNAAFPVGCSACQKRGYKGRIGVFELLIFDEQLRTFITHDTDTGRLRALARQAGSKTLLFDGLNKVKAGCASLDDIALLDGLQI